MAIKLNEIYLTPGRLLVEPIEKSRQDIFEVSESGREISAANVVKVGRLDAEFEGLVPGAAIIYERLNSEALTLQDEEGKDKVYRFVLVRDVAGWVPPVGWVAKPKLPSIKDLIDSRPEYDPIDPEKKSQGSFGTDAPDMVLTPDQMDCGYQKINPGIRLDGNLPRKSILEISREMEREAKKTSINNSAKDVFFGYLKSICKAGVIHINDIDAGIMFNCLDPQWKYFAVQDNGNATIFTNEPYNLAYWAPTMGQVFHIVADLEEMKGMQFIADDYSKSLLKRP